MNKREPKHRQQRKQETTRKLPTLHPSKKVYNRVCIFFLSVKSKYIKTRNPRTKIPTHTQEVYKEEPKSKQSKAKGKNSGPKDWQPKKVKNNLNKTITYSPTRSENQPNSAFFRYYEYLPKTTIYSRKEIWSSDPKLPYCRKPTCSYYAKLSRISK